MSPDGQLIAVAAGGPIFLFEIRAGEIVEHTLNANLDDITSLSFSTDANRLVVASWDHRSADFNQWSIWNVKTGERLANAALRTESMIADATFTSDEASVVFVGIKETCLRYFDAETGELQKAVPWEDGYTAISVSADHRRMVSCGHGSCGARLRGVLLWDVDTGRKLKSFGEGSHFSHVAISRTGNQSEPLWRGAATWMALKSGATMQRIAIQPPDERRSET